MAGNWTRMSREDTIKVLDQLSGHKDAVIFTKETTEVTWRGLPFYSRYELFKLVNYATMPIFTLYYLGNGEEFIPVDGTAGPIYEVNSKDPIRLNEMNVIPYLDFFFANVHGSDGDVFLIKDPNRMPFLSALTPAQRKSVINTFKPLRVSRDADQQSYKISGTVYYGGGLIAATIQVASDGSLEFQEQNLLLSGIHFPPDLHGQAWLDG